MYIYCSFLYIFFDTLNGYIRRRKPKNGVYQNIKSENTKIILTASIHPFCKKAR